MKKSILFIIPVLVAALLSAISCKKSAGPATGYSDQCHQREYGELGDCTLQLRQRQNQKIVEQTLFNH